MFADDDDAPGMPLPENSLPVDSNAPGYRPADVSNKDEQAQKDLDDILNAGESIISPLRSTQTTLF